MRERIGAGRGTAALLALTFVAAGCGGGGDAGGEAGGAAGGAAMENPVDPATAGSLSGMVSFSGVAPDPVAIDMSDEPVCADKHTGEPTMQTVTAGPGGGLADVFIHVTSGPVTSMQFPTDTQAEVLDQNGCFYVPHVVGLQVGQSLTVRNSDAVLHNINATGGSANRGFNRSQPTAGLELTETFPAPEIMIPIRCDVHGWMEAFVGVTAHPYHAVTAADGSFSLPNLPPGDYEIQAWHEEFGTMSQSVTIPASGQAQISFEFTGDMAGRPVPMAEPLYVDHETGRLVPASQRTHSHAGSH